MLLRAAAFAVFGAVSPLLTDVIARVSGVPFLDGVAFGLLLALYLCVCRRVHAAGRLASLVAVSGGAFVLSVLSTMPFQLVGELFPTGRSDNWGPGPTASFLSGILGAGVVSTAFLLLVPNRSLSDRTLGHIVVCAGAGGALGLLGFYAASLFNTSASFLPLFAIWQAGMAFTLTMVAELPADVSTRDPSPAANQTAPLPSSSSFVITVLVALTALGFGWKTVRQIQGKRYLATWEMQNAAFAAAAPSRENLPSPSEQPLEDVFIARINDLRLAGKGSVQHEIPQHAPVPGHARPPERLIYFGSYVGSNEDSNASITIWQYPTTDWARYEARQVLGCSERVVGTQRVLFSDIESWWYSGTRVIRVSAQQPEVDALLKVYLGKYPSDIEESFPLFSLLRRQ